MNRTLVITKQNDRILSALVEDGRIREFRFDEPAGTGILGNVYVGHVKDVKEELSAAFVEIADGIVCFCQLDHLDDAVFLRKGGRRAVSPGDELLVQVKREAIESKFPSVTTQISLPGEYLVLTGGSGRIGISRKLTPVQRTHWTEILQSLSSETFGFILRTSAAEAQEEAVRAEAKTLSMQYETIVRKASLRTSGSLLHRAPEEHKRAVLDLAGGGLAVVTDQEDLCSELEEYCRIHLPDRELSFRIYDDHLLPLSKCYRLERKLDACLNERIWLKSGGFLVIQKTEAMTVIDVNSGKAEAKSRSGKEALLFRINMEAAEEAAEQIRLRNLSGIIIIDFINMKQKSQIEELTAHLQSAVRRDPIPTSVIDITALQLAEVTRKKVRRPTAEVLTEIGYTGSDRQISLKEED